MKRLICASAALLLSGCSYPTSAIEQGQEAGHFKFVGTPGTVVRVDGQDRGAIGAAGWLVVDIEPGKHVAEEDVGGQAVLHREYEVGAGAKVQVGG
jgi:hypothetical protein